MSDGHGKGLRRAMNHIVNQARSNTDKEQPQLPQGAPLPGTNGLSVPLHTPLSPRPNTRGPPTRSQTVDLSPTATKTTTAISRSKTPEATSAATTTVPPAHAPASAYPPSLAPGPASLTVPGSALCPGTPPAASSTKRLDRSDRVERPRPDPGAQRLKDLEETINGFQEAVNFFQSEPYRQELLSIRTHLQVNDLKEPHQISKDFQAIAKQIENVSRDLSEFLADGYQPRAPLTTNDFTAWAQLYPPKSTEREQRDKAASVVSAEDFVDFCCRAQINEALMETIFTIKKFHPGLEPGENEVICRMYQKVREQEPQIIAGRWRVSSFNTYKSTPFNPENIATNFCDYHLYPLCRAVYEDKSAKDAVHKMYPEIVSVFDHAWKWQASVKSSLVLLDFLPFYYAPGTPFNPRDSSLEGRRPTPPASGTILLMSRLGLLSSEAQGGGKHPKEFIQVPAMVLGAEWFANNR